MMQMIDQRAWPAAAGKRERGGWPRDYGRKAKSRAAITRPSNTRNLHASLLSAPLPGGHTMAAATRRSAALLAGLMMLMLLATAAPGDARRLEQAAAKQTQPAAGASKAAGAPTQPAAKQQQPQPATSAPRKAAAPAPQQPAVAKAAAAPATAVAAPQRSGGSWAPTMNLPAGFDEGDAAAEAMLPAIDALARELPHVQLFPAGGAAGLATAQHVRGMDPAMLVEDAAFNGF